MRYRSIALFLSLGLLTACGTFVSRHSPADAGKPWSHGPLMVSPDGHFLQHADGTPFFWLGDTAWLLNRNLRRAEVTAYMADRAFKGFNVVQCSILHSRVNRNVYGDLSSAGNDPSFPLETPGNDPDDPKQYDYWDHIDFCVDEAARHGLYFAIVMTWGSNVRSGAIDVDGAIYYASFLAERYKDRPNIVWINGGDTMGDQNVDVWNTFGNTVKKIDPVHLMTFHPFGRTDSAWWYHNAPWLDFNMCQSGHRSYDMAENNELGEDYTEDNWRYVLDDYALKPTKPILDGEPSYEGIPHGLHDPTMPLWTFADARRYAWWAVIAGACGHTYGNAALMGVSLTPNRTTGKTWDDAVHDVGASEMRFVKQLMLSRPYFERAPDRTAVVGDPGERYDRVLASRGKGYLFAYVHTGRTFTLNLGRISGSEVKAWWYNPRVGAAELIGVFPNTGTREFDPPGIPRPGNDWVLVLDDAALNFPQPGQSESAQR